MIVYEDMSYKYDGNTVDKDSSLKVDSHQTRNTSDNIASLREYCIVKSGCDKVPAPKTTEIDYLEIRSLETIERAVGL